MPACSTCMETLKRELSFSDSSLPWQDRAHCWPWVASTNESAAPFPSLGLGYRWQLSLTCSVFWLLVLLCTYYSQGPGVNKILINSVGESSWRNLFTSLLHTWLLLLVTLDSDWPGTCLEINLPALSLSAPIIGGTDHQAWCLKNEMPIP